MDTVINQANNIRGKSAILTAVVILLATGLTACGGTKVLKESKPITATQALVGAEDDHLMVSLDWLIVRDGPGTWAKNADWDEYLLRIHNQGNESIQIQSVSVQDSLGNWIEAGDERKQLVKATRDTKRRYENHDIKVKAGWGAGVFLAASAAGYATVGSVASAASLGVMTSTGAAVAAGGLLLTPIMAGAAITRGVNNSRVNKQIKERGTKLPAELPCGEGMPLDLFFPLTPSPQQIEIRYIDSTGPHTLSIDTKTVLKGLHLSGGDDLV